MKIEVTAEHIAKGERKQCCACPIALALNEATDGEWVVGPLIASDFRGGKFDLPSIACRFIDDFDNRRPVQPFAFDLPLELPHRPLATVPQSE